MKAVVLHEFGGPGNLKYEDWPDPSPGPGEVLVRVAASSVNPIDFKMRSGEAQSRFPIELPYVLGRDISGVVRELGADVEGFAVGDPVLALTWHAYAELVVVKAADLVHLPEGLGVVPAAALPLVTLTGDQLIRVGTGIHAGQSILVTGAVGGVGRTAVMVAKTLGAIVTAGVRTQQLKEAEELGADHVLALDDAEALAGCGPFDAIADTVGHETADALLARVNPGGVFASVLGPPAKAAVYPAVKVVPVMAKVDAAALFQLAGDVAAGRLTIPIDRMIPLAEATEGHRAAEKGGIGKVLLLA